MDPKKIKRLKSFIKQLCRHAEREAKRDGEIEAAAIQCGLSPESFLRQACSDAIRQLPCYPQKTVKVGTSLSRYKLYRLECEGNKIVPLSYPKAVYLYLKGADFPPECTLYKIED